MQINNTMYFVRLKLRIFYFILVILTFCKFIVLQQNYLLMFGALEIKWLIKYENN